MFLTKHVKFIALFSVLFMFVAFFYKGIIFLDPDFGWHIKLGELTSFTNIYNSDPFSYTMTSFPFIDHEWLTNILLWKGYLLFGNSALSAIYAFLAFLALFFSLNNSYSSKNRKEKKRNFLFLTLFIIGAGTTFPFFGIRPQVQSWLLFSIFVNLILNTKIRNKFFFLSPLLILLWVNLHGSFAIGLVSLFLVVFLKSLGENKFWIKGFVVLCLSVLFSFINPYKARIWHEVWLQISDTSLRWTIQEWRPVFFSFDIFYLFIAVLSVMLIKKYSKIFTLEELGLNLFLFVQSFLSIRHIPLWIIVDLPMVYLAMKEFYFELKDVKFGRERCLKIIGVTYVVVFIMFLITFCLGVYFSKGLRENTFYPQKAIGFLTNNLPNGNIFSEYGWGGYLIWKFPEKKVFIDGRMPSWRWNKSVLNESNYIMRDYTNILKGKEDYKIQFAKYNIDTVLWPKPKKENVFEGLEKSILSFVERMVIPNDKFDFLSSLEADGWNKIYEDDVAVIHQKK